MSERHIYLATKFIKSGQDFTKVRKILVERNKIKPLADGEVRGSITNQFFLDEFGQFLRVATTNELGPLRNNLFVLDSQLKLYGSLLNFGQIKKFISIRFTESRCYIVAAGGKNPFFVINLQNHRLPKILGDL